MPTMTDQTETMIEDEETLCCEACGEPIPEGFEGECLPVADAATGDVIMCCASCASGTGGAS
jgi:hypothetical protein